MLPKPIPQSTQEVLNGLTDRASALNLSMRDLCKEAGVAYSTVTRWRSGFSDPLKSITKLDAVLRHHEEQNNR